MKHEWPIVEEIVGSRQWIFDRVVRHYRARPRRCAVAGKCAYRSGDERCFAGALIDDAHYDPDMEGFRAGDMLKYFSLPAWFRENISFINDIQRIHDTEENWPVMDMVLEMFAVERGLRMPA